MRFVHFNEGMRFFRRRLFYRTNKRYSGSGELICRQIADSCYNGKYFQVSNFNYRQFYSRDFGWCVKSLLLLDKRKEVLKTLRYALSRMTFEERIKVALTPEGEPFDFPDVPSIDSAAYIFFALKAANAKKLVNDHSEFLESAALNLCRTVVDEDGLPKLMQISGMRDYAKRFRSCYDVSALAFMGRNLDELGLHNPLRKIDYASILKNRYWTGNHFRDDLSGKSAITADANIYPFFWNIIEDHDMMMKAIDSMKGEKLDAPLFVRYTAQDNPDDDMIWLNHLVHNWEKNNYWAHMDPAYTALLRRIDKDLADERRKRTLSSIKSHGTLFEVYDSDGLPFKTPFYVSDEGMLWAANYASKSATYQ